MGIINSIHHKQLISIIGLLLCLLIVLPASAQQTDEDPLTPEEIAAIDDGLISFKLAGYEDRTLRGPIDGFGFWIGLPASWEPTDNVELILDLTTFYTSGLTGQSPSDTQIGGILEVSFNRIFLAAIVLEDDGDQTIRIPIPPEVLAASTSIKNRHRIDLKLDSARQCESPHEAFVVVHADSSFLSVPHEIAPLPLDLTNFPAPLYQESFLPDEITIIVPDEPSQTELKSAMLVAAGLGRVTGRETLIQLTNVSGADSPEFANSQLILVGLPENLPMLDELPLPAQYVDGTGFAASGKRSDDGVIQLTSSPNNIEQAVLVVSGDNEEALVKAAQAVSSGTIRPGARSNLALVANVSDLIAPSSLNEQTITFANLGFSTSEVTGSGTEVATINFYLQEGIGYTRDSNITLVFNNAPNLDFDRSGMIVRINDQIIGSAQFAEETVAITAAQFTIPPSLLTYGNNEISISTELRSRALCNTNDNETNWANIWDESTLSLVIDESVVIDRPPLNLRAYPNPFALESSLDQTALILPKNDVNAWNIGMLLAADLGRRVDGDIFLMEMAYADAVPDEIRDNYDLLVVGKASQIPIVEELNEVLPAPFPAGENIADERNVQVVYRTQSDGDIGYLQTVTSPWNPEKSVLGVFGSSDIGLGWASDALILGTLRNQLDGSYAAVLGEQITLGNRAVSDLATAQGNIEAVLDSEVAEQIAQGEIASRTVNSWILPAMAATFVLMGLIIIYAVIFRWARRDR